MERETGVEPATSSLGSAHDAGVATAHENQGEIDYGCGERTEAVRFLVPYGPLGKLAERLTLMVAWHNGMWPL
jgi:hypothetical protein